MLRILLKLLIIASVFYKSCSILVVPPTSPTRHQLISGIGIPLALEDEAITLGLVMKAQYFLAETANQLKFNFFPDIFENVTKDYLFDTVWHEFPNGRRRRRDVLMDPSTGQKYESFDATVQQIADVPLKLSGSDDDTFEDEFEEDVVEREMMEEFWQQQQEQQQQGQNEEKKSEKENDVDLSMSRWIAYDALGSMLQR
jgi:hypothetical protein